LNFGCMSIHLNGPLSQRVRSQISVNAVSVLALPQLGMLCALLAVPRK